MQRFLLISGFALLFVVEILHVYFIMPFPGSQHGQTIDIAYKLSRNMYWARFAGFCLIAYPLVQVLLLDKMWKKIVLCLVVALYAAIFFFFNFRFEADKMFYQPKNKNFAILKNNKVDSSKLVIGVAINGEAKAYPIQIIGYHHQVQDTVGEVPVMVTYCTVCRTGRAFSPIVNGKKETFRLVGMDHFNAMFEDATTKSWWQQATGVAIAGPLKGNALKEIPSSQSTLAAWMRQHPNSTILQPDTLYTKDYDDLADYDKGTLESGLEKRDSASWKRKSWVVGIADGEYAKAYDWNELIKNKIIQDSLPGLPLIIVLEKDTVTFHAWNREVGGNKLQFNKRIHLELFSDANTNSLWNMDGECVEGILKGQKLRSVQSYQEFWHSWSTFHPGTKK
ncbi:MAG TPA: DUF3179 domain-containing (seleno)protein [Puia sp.]|jgi:hypothetical protein|nr:DUF3179 domain-containing (seleno)protein [Puia sp.]